jgi:hypothetical protein
VIDGTLWIGAEYPISCEWMTPHVARISERRQPSRHSCFHTLSLSRDQRPGLPGGGFLGYSVDVAVSSGVFRSPEQGGDMTAQGNALGYERHTPSGSPEGALQRTSRKLHRSSVTPLQGSPVLWTTVPRALPWAVMSPPCSGLRSIATEWSEGMLPRRSELRHTPVGCIFQDFFVFFVVKPLCPVPIRGV